MKHSTLDEIKNRNHPGKKIKKLESDVAGLKGKDTDAGTLDEFTPEGGGNQGPTNFGTDYCDDLGVHSCYVHRPAIFVTYTTSEMAITEENILSPNFITNRNDIIHYRVIGRLVNNTGSSRTFTFRCFYDSSAGLPVTAASAITVTTSTAERAFKYEVFISQSQINNDRLTVEEFIFVDGVTLSRQTHEYNTAGTLDLTDTTNIFATVEMSAQSTELNVSTDKVIICPIRGKLDDNRIFTRYFTQPAAVDSADSFIRSNQATTNFGTNTQIAVGEQDGAVSVNRGLIKPSLGTIPSNFVPTQVYLGLVISADLSTQARDFKLYRILRNWVEDEVTWNVWSSGNNWTTAGAGSDGNDVDLTNVWATLSFTSTETVGALKVFEIDAALFKNFIDGTYPYYGFLIKADTETNDEYLFHSSDATSPWLRPYLLMLGDLT